MINSTAKRIYNFYRIASSVLKLTQKKAATKKPECKFLYSFYNYRVFGKTLDNFAVWFNQSLRDRSAL